MSYQPYEIVASFSALAWMIATAMIGIACHLHSKRGGDRAFGISAWFAFACLLCVCVPYTAQIALAYLSESLDPETVQRGYSVLFRIYGVSEILSLGFTLAFATGAWRTANRLRRLPTPSAASGNH